jgi:putative intracellular protease/amidase
MPLGEMTTMTRSILMVLTSHSQLGNTGQQTGSWLEELAAPYYTFLDAGFAVELASIAGGIAPLDPVSREGAWVTEAGKRFLADPGVMQSLRRTQAIASVTDTDYSALFLVGGTGAAWDFTGNPYLKAFAESLERRNAVLAAVCHGVLGLTDLTTADGQWLLKGRRATGVSNREEELFGLTTVVPVLPEERLRKAGAFYLAAAPLEANVVGDGNLYTGQNPASARPLAEAVVRAIAA